MNANPGATALRIGRVARLRRETQTEQDGTSPLLRRGSPSRHETVRALDRGPYL